VVEGSGKLMHPSAVTSRQRAAPGAEPKPIFQPGSAKKKKILVREAIL